MTETTPSPLNNVITIDDERIKNHLRLCPFARVLPPRTWMHAAVAIVNQTAGSQGPIGRDSRTTAAVRRFIELDGDRDRA